MSVTWTDVPAAHAAQIYVEDHELAESVAKYVVTGFEIGEPAVLVATEEHAGLIAEQLAALGWDAGRIEELGLLLAVDAETTLGRFMEGPHPSAAAFERVIGGLLDELAPRFPGRRVRAFGEMVNILCEQGQREAAVELEELWNRLAQTRDFTLLCGYRVDLFDRASQVETLPDVCRLHTHVAPARDAERLSHAVDDALVGVLDARSGPGVLADRHRDPRASRAGLPARPDVGQRAHAAERRADPRLSEDAIPRRAPFADPDACRKRPSTAARAGRLACGPAQGDPDQAPLLTVHPRRSWQCLRPRLRSHR